jgi:hypothetical protein
MQGINTPGSLQRGVIPRSFEVRETYPKAYRETSCSKIPHILPSWIW